MKLGTPHISTDFIAYTQIVIDTNHLYGVSLRRWVGETVRVRIRVFEKVIYETR